MITLININCFEAIITTFGGALRRLELQSKMATKQPEHHASVNNKLNFFNFPSRELHWKYTIHQAKMDRNYKILPNEFSKFEKA